MANAQAMLDSWDARAQLFAAFGLGLDYLFMPAYGLTAALACLLVARRHTGTLRRVGSSGFRRQVDQAWIFDVVFDVAGAGGAMHGIG